MDTAASALVAAVLQDPAAPSATKRYQFAQLCAQKSETPSSKGPQEQHLPFALVFCTKLSAEANPPESDASLCEWWKRQSARSSEQADHRQLAGDFVKRLMSHALDSDAKALEDDANAGLGACPECEAALRDVAEEEFTEPADFHPPPASRKLRAVNLKALAAPVTTQEVQKALKHIMEHRSLSSEMRCKASQILDRSSAITNYATAIEAMLGSSGSLWEWGDGAALPPHRHSVHGLKKCRVFSEPTAILMMTFLEVFTGRLLSEASKSLNPLQRWRHKHEVRGSAHMVQAALERTQNYKHGDASLALQSRTNSLQAMRLQLRNRFDFPLSQGCCYEGSGDAFAKLFQALRVELELHRLCFGNVNGHPRALKTNRDGSEETSDDSDGDCNHDIHDFELVGEKLTVLKSDLRCCCKNMPHSLIVHCLKALGLSPDWLSFFKSYLEAPLPSAKFAKRGMPLGSSLSTLLLEIVGSFLDLWLHAGFLQRSRANQSTGGSSTPVLASLRCGDDIWFITRSDDASRVWDDVKDLHTKCGLELNLDDSGSVALGGNETEKPPLAHELQQPPCWSLLQLTPECNWKVAEWRLKPRVSRAMTELQVPGMSLISRVKVFNEYVQALLGQGGFHEDLYQSLQPLHLCMSSLFEKAVEQEEHTLSTPLPQTSTTLTLQQILSVLLWWPRQSGGLGARHISVALHGEHSRLAPLLPSGLSSDKPLDSCVQSALWTTSSRANQYESHLHTLFGPVIEDRFGTLLVLDGRYTSLLS